MRYNTVLSCRETTDEGQKVSRRDFNPTTEEDIIYWVSSESNSLDSLVSRLDIVERR